MRLLEVKNLAWGYTTYKSSWSLNLKPVQGYLPLSHARPATHFQTDFIRTIKWTQKCIRFDQKTKLPANTDSILYTENSLEISLCSKQVVLFLVCWWPRLNSLSRHLKRSVNSSFRRLGQNPAGLPFCFPRKSGRPLPCATRFPFRGRALCWGVWSLLCAPCEDSLVMSASWWEPFCLSRKHNAVCVVNLQQTWWL